MIVDKDTCNVMATYICTGGGNTYILFSWSHTNDMFVIRNDACLLGRGSFLQTHDCNHA